jgi:hypothetical protein
LAAYHATGVARTKELRLIPFQRFAKGKKLLKEILTRGNLL